MEARPLPPRPSLEQYKKQARDLLKACTSSGPHAIHAWARQWVEACAGACVETDARLRGEVNRIEKEIRASKLSEPQAKLADAQFFLARGHGFESWPKFARQLHALQLGNSRDARFEAAADAVVSGDIRTLEQLLREDPQLIRTRSQRTHNAPLLHYIAANGVENFRQKTPQNIVEITNLLLDAGAGINEESNAYGGGATALDLVATSVHPERAGVQEQLMQFLLDHGADTDNVVAGCLCNGRGNAARFLASRGVRLDLETAAGVGNLELVKGFFSANGALNPDATEQKLQRGFLWACQYGHDPVADFLLTRGANLRDQAKTGQTALHWAIVGGGLATIRLLLERGAPLEERNAYGGTPLGQAGWSFFNGNPEIDYVPVFETLLAAGAKIEEGWLAWLNRQESRPAVAKARIAEVLRRYGAVN